jgi:hypothetical protein
MVYCIDLTLDSDSDTEPGVLQLIALAGYQLQLDSSF